MQEIYDINNIQELLTKEEYYKVIYICQEILSIDPENKYVLQVLALAKRRLQEQIKKEENRYKRHLIPVIVACCLLVILGWAYMSYSISFSGARSIKFETEVAKQIPQLEAKQDQYKDFPVPKINARNLQTEMPGWVVFDASKSFSPKGGIISEYEWDFGDGEQESGKKVTHKYFKNGKYTISLKVTDEWEQTQIMTRDVLVGQTKKEVPSSVIQAKPAIVDGVITGKAPLKVFLNAKNSVDLDGEIVNYWWDLGDATYSNDAKLVHLYEKKGEYPVLLIVEDNDGNSHLSYLQIIVE